MAYQSGSFSFAVRWLQTVCHATVVVGDVSGVFDKLMGFFSIVVSDSSLNFSLLGYLKCHVDPSVGVFPLHRLSFIGYPFARGEIWRVGSLQLRICNKLIEIHFRCQLIASNHLFLFYLLQVLDF